MAKQKEFVFYLNGSAVVYAKNYDDAVNKLMDKKIIDLDIDYECE